MDPPGVASRTVLSIRFMLYILSSRRNNLSSTSYEFLCQTMLYMMFDSLFAPYALGLTYSNLNPGTICFSRGMNDDSNCLNYRADHATEER